MFALTTLFRKIQSLFERYDFLVMPTNARTALHVTHDAASDEVVIDGVKCGITREGWTSYQYQSKAIRGSHSAMSCQ